MKRVRFEEFEMNEESEEFKSEMKVVAEVENTLKPAMLEAIEAYGMASAIAGLGSLVSGVLGVIPDDAFESWVETLRRGRDIAKKGYETIEKEH